MYGDASEASNPVEQIDELSEEDKSKTLYHKPLPQKAAIVVAGPVANFILTICILTGLMMNGGLPSAEPVIGEVLKGSAAEIAGLKVGDRILQIDDQKVVVFGDIPKIIRTNLGTSVNVKLQRADRELFVTLIPKQITEKDPLGNEYTHPQIGIGTHTIKMEEVGFPRAVWEATYTTYNYCTTTLEVIGQIIQGKRNFSENITGPIGMAKMSGQAVNKGFFTVLVLMANISASLGLVNLFPIPPLDGGHLLYYGIEAISGRPLAKKFREYSFRVGIALVAMLMAYAVLNDLHKLLLTFAK